MTIKDGIAAEELAQEHLVARGLKYIGKNFNSRVGEIDLIMRDGEYLVFVEVRARKSAKYGGAIVSINYQKMQKIIKTASLYLLKNKISDKYPVRFDVVTLDGRPAKIRWIKNAFSA